MAGIFLNIVLHSRCFGPERRGSFPPGDKRDGDVLPDRRRTGSLGPVVPRFRPRLLHDSEFLGGLLFPRPSPA